MNKLIAVILILIAVYLGQYSFKDLQWWAASPAQKLAFLIEDDLAQLQAQGVLTPEWLKIKEVNFVSTSVVTEEWLKTKRPQLKTDPQGAYRLEVVLIDWQVNGESKNDNGSGGIVQMSLLDIASNNKIAEIGRTYNLDKP